MASRQSWRHANLPRPGDGRLDMFFHWLLELAIYFGAFSDSTGLQVVDTIELKRGRIMRTLAGTIFIASLGLICLSLACSSTSQSPTGATPIPGPDATPPGGRWEGTSTVESLGDDVPECVAASWSAGSVSTVSADVSPSINSIHMVLYSQVNQGCELGGTLFDNRIDAKAWQRDEFDCAMVPSLCGVGCHYRVRTTDWNCAVPAPEIWITDANFRATINPTADRIQGVVLMDYAHSITARPQWKNLRVTARIDLRKTN